MRYLVLLLFTTFLYSNDQYLNLQFQKDNSSIAVSSIVKDETHYYLSTNIFDEESISNSLLLTKLNMDKEIVKEYSFSVSDSIIYIGDIKLIDNFIYMSVNVSEPNKYYNTIIMKFDKNFNLLSQKSILREKKDDQSWTLKSDGEFIYAIGSMNKLTIQFDKRFPFMIKMDKELDVIDSVKGEPNNYQIYDYLFKDGKIITTGSTNLSGDCYIREYDMNFNLMSEIPLPSYFSQPWILKEFNDNLLLASIAIEDRLYLSSLLTKLDYEYNILTETFYGTEYSDAPNQLLIDSNSIISIGHYHSKWQDPENSPDAGFTTFDHQLNELDTYYFNTDPLWSRFFSGCFTDENNFILVGHNHENGWILESDLEGNYNPNVTVGVKENNNPENTILLRNYPNPFNPTTTITYSIDSDSEVKLVVMDIMGREIGSFSQGVVSTGTHSIVFDGSNLATGVYLYTLIVDGVTKGSEKMVVVK